MASDKSIFKDVPASDPLVMSPTLSRLLCEARESKSPNRDPEQIRALSKREAQRRVWSATVLSPTILSPDTVQQVFPAVPHIGTGNRSVRQTQCEGLQQRNKVRTDDNAEAAPTHLQVTGAAAMGFFGWLPGELRNQIYRDLLVRPHFTHVACNEAVCGKGACEHTKLSSVVPIACTCRQIRHEVMPIFCSENIFLFDVAMVRNRCVANWLASINVYIRLMPQLILQLEMRSRRRVGVTVSWPSGQLTVCYDDAVPRKWINEGKLDDLLTRVNMQPGRPQDKLMEIAASDELSDLVWSWRRRWR